MLWLMIICDIPWYFQRNDIAMAISKYDQFDFLIDIVPRDELKPTKSRDDANRTGVPTDQVCLWLTEVEI